MAQPPGSPEAPAKPVLIDREELVAALRARSIVPIDAQAPGWYESERLPGARRARPEDLDSLHTTLPDGRDTELAVYCWDRGCEASAQVARLLIERGYTRVRRYVGGKRDWIAAGLPVERGAP